MGASPLGRASRVERRSTSGDALTGLYERHGKRIFRYCVHLLRSREDAEDAMQTTFMYAFRALERGVVPELEAPWLVAIARNVCLSRTHARRRHLVEVPQDPTTLAEHLVAAAPVDELDGLDDALAGLTPQQRQAIVLREWHGLSYREIAQRLELSQSAVETLLFRARRALARQLRRLGVALPWLRSLVGSAAGKVALGAAVVAVTAGTTGTLVAPEQRARQRPAQRVARGIVAKSPRPTPPQRIGASQAAAIPRRREAKPTAVARRRDRLGLPPPLPAASHASSSIGAEKTSATDAAAATSANAPARPVDDGARSTADTAADAANRAAGVVDTATDAVAPAMDGGAGAVDENTGVITDIASGAVTTAISAVDAVTSAVPSVTTPAVTTPDDTTPAIVTTATASTATPTTPGLP
jgi:RNA polymerase sigma factor (sigma-70 family)